MFLPQIEIPLLYHLLKLSESLPEIVLVSVFNQFGPKLLLCS